MANSSCADTGKIFAKKLSVLCEDKKMSRAQLADKLHVSRQMIDKYINAEVKNIPSLMVVTVAELFGVSTDYLLTDSEIRTPDKSIEAVCDVTGLSEDSVYMLCRPEVSGTAEYLLHDEQNLDFFRHLRDYLATSLMAKDNLFSIDPFDPKIVKLLDGKLPNRESVYKENSRDVLEQMLLNRLRKELEGFRDRYIDWLTVSGDRIEADE